MSVFLSLTDELMVSAQGYRKELETYHRVTLQLTLAKRALETARTHHLCTGIEGKNQAERDAKLASLLVEETTAVEFLEDEQAGARLGLEQARLAWDLTRYKVRALEAVRVEA